MKSLSLATESIAFQTGAFFNELKIIIEEARVGAMSNEVMLKTSMAIANCVKKHTNISTVVRYIDNWDNAGIMLPTLSPRNILSQAKGDLADLFWYGTRQKLKIGRDELIEGLVDSKKSRVDGYFATIEHRMFIGSDMIFGKEYTVGQAAAIVLHEVGHAFTLLQFLADDMSTNYVLMQTYQDLIKPENKGKIRIELQNSSKRLGIADRDGWVSLIEDKDADVAFRVYCAWALKELTEDHDNKRFYTQDTSEELADIFAVRHGAAREVIELRSRYDGDKRKYKENDVFGIRTGLYLTLTGFLGTALLIPFPAVAPLAIVPVLVAITGMLTLGGGLQSAASTPSLTTGAQSIMKVRNQMVQKIKELPLTPAEIKDVIQLVEIAESKALDMKDSVDLGFAAAFMDMFRSRKMSAEQMRDYTDRVERLATNSLFVKAAALSVA